MIWAVRIAFAIGAVALFLAVGWTIGESLGSFMIGMVVETTILLTFVPFLSRLIAPDRRRSV